jgi:D-glucosaminate-specific PTS system IIB component
MWRIVFARVDDRLIHGQVITKWVKWAQPELIAIVDDVLAADKFMGDIYKMAAPPGIEVKVVDVNTALEEWQKNKLEQKKVLVLFKDILTAKETIEGGLPVKELNIGGIRKKPGSKSRQFTGSISLEETDVKMLLDLEGAWNVEIYLRMIPEYERLEFPSIVKKYYPGLESSLKKEAR